MRTLGWARWTTYDPQKQEKERLSLRQCGAPLRKEAEVPGCTRSSRNGCGHGLHCADPTPPFHPWQLPCVPGMEEQWLCVFSKVANLRRPNKKRGVFWPFVWLKQEALTSHCTLIKGLLLSGSEQLRGPWGNITFRKPVVIDLKSWVSSQRDQPLGIKKSPWNTLSMPYYFILQAWKSNEGKK